MKLFALLSIFLLAEGAFGVDRRMDLQAKRIHESAALLAEIMNAEERSIPRDLLEKAHCVGIVPNLKRAGFIEGAKEGAGVITCRHKESRAGWSAPSTIRVEGGSIGFQIGLGETDVIFVVMDKNGEDAFLKDKFTVGADASAAGPVGRPADAQTDAIMSTKILAYSRSGGVFAGVTLDGVTLRPDNEGNRQIYGYEATQGEILRGKVQPPASAGELFSELNRYAPVQTK